MIALLLDSGAVIDPMTRVIKLNFRYYDSVKQSYVTVAFDEKCCNVCEDSKMEIYRCSVNVKSCDGIQTILCKMFFTDHRLIKILAF